MQYKQTLVVLLGLYFPFLSFSQVTTYLPQGATENNLLERLEIKAGTNPVLNFSKTKPYSRRHVIPAIEKIYQAGATGAVPTIPDSLNLSDSEVAARLTKVDLYNLELALQSNSEFSTQKFQSKRPFLGVFYKTPA